MSLSGIMKPEKPWVARGRSSVIKARTCLAEGLIRSGKLVESAFDRLLYMCNLEKMEQMLKYESPEKLVAQYLQHNPKALILAGQCLFHENRQIRLNAASSLKKAAECGTDLSKIFNALAKAAKDQETKKHVLPAIVACAPMLDKKILPKAIRIMANEWECIDQVTAMDAIKIFTSAAAEGIEFDATIHGLKLATGNGDPDIAIAASGCLNRLTIINNDMLASILLHMIDLCKNRRICASEKVASSIAYIFKRALETKETEELAINGIIALVTHNYNYVDTKGMRIISTSININALNAFMMKHDIGSEIRVKILYEITQSREFTAEAEKNSTLYEALFIAIANELTRIRRNMDGTATPQDREMENFLRKPEVRTNEAH